MITVRFCISLLLLSLFCVSINANATLWERRIRLQRQTGNQKCILPPYPKNGFYLIGGKPSAKPGDRVDSAQVHVTCQPGFKPTGNHILYCVLGSWSQEMPKCSRSCRLDPHPSVDYRCQVTTDDSEDSYYRNCEERETSGTIVRPQCNEPNYHYTGILSPMICLEGRWNYVAICQPECGTVTPDGKPLVIDGRESKRGEFPWHAGIYRKDMTFKFICGGSLVSNNIIISAAHCFWDKNKSTLRPASLFAVALGKFYRGWANTLDEDIMQKFDVVNVKVPARYQGASSNFQDDIAVVRMSSPVQLSPYVRPVCLDFDPFFDSHQLRDGNLGKVAGWGIKDLEGNLSPVLQVLELPYVGIERCIEEAPSTFRPFITSDKICAGYTNGSSVCQGDSGGGLVFIARDRFAYRYYLRGIVSTAPETEEACNAFSRTTFTKIIKHKTFIEKNTLVYIETHTPEAIGNLCILPPFPQHGSYSALGSLASQPGESAASVQLLVTCDKGYVLEKDVAPSCNQGNWTEDVPNCILTNRATECGRVTQNNELALRRKRVIGGANARPGELPWHTTIYTKTTTPYSQICTGSLVSTTVVISAAHCFWNNAEQKLSPVSDYAAVVGRIYRSWSNPDDSYSQKSEIKEIKVPNLFLGMAGNFQQDISIVKLAKAVTTNAYINPICVDFDTKLRGRHLSKGKLGKIAGFGLTGENGKPSPILQVVELPYIEIGECIRLSPPVFREFLTGDKFCAGYTNGTAALCRGDTGGGLVYSEMEGGAERYYVRGVASTAPTSKSSCNIYTFTTFSDIAKHEEFIKENLVDT